MKIIYEDRDVLVVFKEAGLAAETKKPLEKDLVSMLRTFLAERDGRAGGLFLIHRIDQPVDGLVLFARNKKAAAALSARLSGGKMEKIYRARVTGKIAAEEGTLEDWLLKDARSNRSRIVPAGTPGAKRAVLTYKKESEDTLRIRLETGRHHQIRVQLSGAGMPIAGDVRYGGKAGAGRGIFLTAAELSFEHPADERRMHFSVPEELRRF